MAYINVAEWTPDQVTDWLKGLDDSMYSYVYSFTNNEVGGQQLLNIRPYELEQLGMHAIGHQEIVLEAVEILRNFHYNLDKENLQFMALHVATAARSLHRQLAVHCDASKVETQILNDITRTIATIKPLISWLDRAPFHGQQQFMEICLNMLRRGLEMATIAQRDRFADKPVEQIRETALRLENLANYIIQDISDPMLLQPASLNLVTLKKRESELGFSIEPNYHGVHRVTDIKYNSPAHNSGKIEDGDEIVQINYQTVVGWQYKTVLMQLRESLPDVLLTLKKRPKHTKIYGQIYMQPYRLPSKKRNVGTRWGENLPSPRAGFLTVPEAATAFQLPLSLKTEQNATTASACSASDTESSDSDILTPTDQKSTPQEIRLYYPKPRAMLQRRNTICGDEYLNLHNGSANGTFPKWQERNTSGLAGDPSSPSLRDKSVSFGFGLDATLPRPTTCIGISSSRVVANKMQAGGNSKNLETLPEERLKLGVSKVVRFDANMTSDSYKMDEKYTCNVQNTILETFEPIPFADDEEEEDALNATRNSVDCSSEQQVVDAVNLPLVARRGRLDKSHSTPAYDNSADEQPPTTPPPPAIEPRQSTQAQMPPVPPPRPRKTKDMMVPPPPPKPMKPRLVPTPNIPADIPLTVHETTLNNNNDNLPLPVAEVNELHTPAKSRTLTLKKKHNLIAKRRNVNLKLLGTGEIQGHLYRRTKDRRGVTFWARIYFVMLDTILYGFRSKEANKASCVIFLPGFTVSLAKEVHSKPFAFKVYHAEKTFYFAAESQAALNQWVEFIRQSALQSTVLLTQVNVRDLFSETESSGEENESIILNNLSTPSPQAPKDIATTQSIGVTNNSAGSAANGSQTPLASAKHDRRYLGSLRKLTKNTLHFKNAWSSNNEKKPSSDIPVPTQQYRSYRKVPGGSFGLQIGTNTPGYYDQSFQQTLFQTPTTTATTTVPLTPTKVNTNEIQDVAPALPRKMSMINKSNVEQIITTTTTTITTTTTTTPTNVVTTNPLISNNIINNSQVTGTMTIITTTAISTPTSTNSSRNDSANNSPGMRSLKKIPYNFIHASNPNLVEFDFQTSKTLDYSLPKINAGNAWDVAHQTTSSSIQGFVTLKDLMLQKQQEEAQEMYNNRVLLGVEKKDVSRRLAAAAAAENAKSQQQQQQQQECSGSGKVSKTQNRSLPKTPDYEISFKPDDENIKRTRTKEGLKLRDFGYELISGDEPISSTSMHSRHNSNVSNYKYNNNSIEQQQQQQQHLSKTARQFLKTQQFLLSGARNKKHSTASISSTTSSMTSASSDFSEKGRGDSFKKAFKNSSERLFQFNKHHQHAVQQQQQQQNMTMTLPLHKKCISNLDEHTMNGAVGAAGSSSIRKSHTYNHDLKDKCDKYDAQRKNSAPIFSKLNFSNSSSTANVNSNNNSSNNNNNGKSAKEKKLLGSPLLHRTIFGRGGGATGSSCTGEANYAADYEGEIFSQVILPKVPSNHYNEQVAMKYRLLSQSSVVSGGSTDVNAPPVPSASKSSAASTPTSRNSSTTHTPEYPNMECPPVFEPEMYSLSDSNASLSLLLRRNNSAESTGGEKNTTTKNTQE